MADALFNKSNKRLNIEHGKNAKILFKFSNLKEIGGEAGIRTLGTVTGTPHFECGAFDHSATSPQKVGKACESHALLADRPGRGRPLADDDVLAKKALPIFLVCATSSPT